MRTSLLAIVAVFSLLGASLAVAQDVSVAIDIGVPPPISFAAPPDVVVVPSGESYVYMVPNRVGLYFYGGRWYRHHLGHWFQSGMYNGSWALIDIGLVPGVVIEIPPEYPRFLPSGYHRVHYGDLHRHWNDWDRGRHWHGQDWYRREMRPEIRRERFSRIEQFRGTRSVAPRSTLGAGPGPRSTLGAGPGPRIAPSAGLAPRTAPSAGLAPRTTPSAGPGPRTTPSAGLAPRTAPSAGLAPRTAPSAGLAPRTAPSAGPGPRTTPSAGPGPRTTPSAGLAPRTAPSAGPGPRSTPSAGAGTHAPKPAAGAGPRSDRREK
jgi:hypothetical protein